MFNTYSQFPQTFLTNLSNYAEFYLFKVPAVITEDLIVYISHDIAAAKNLILKLLKIVLGCLGKGMII